MVKKIDIVLFFSSFDLVTIKWRYFEMISKIAQNCEVTSTNHLVDADRDAQCAKYGKNNSVNHNDYLQKLN